MPDRGLGHDAENIQSQQYGCLNEKNIVSDIPARMPAWRGAIPHGLTPLDKGLQTVNGC